MDDAAKAARAKEFQAAKWREERRNHTERIEWLTAPNPIWGCGTSVAEHERIRTLQESRDYIAYLDRIVA